MCLCKHLQSALRLRLLDPTGTLYADQHNRSQVLPFLDWLGEDSELAKVGIGVLSTLSCLLVCAASRTVHGTIGGFAQCAVHFRPRHHDLGATALFRDGSLGIMVRARVPVDVAST